ncbi:hypothetical protein VTI74DRAFT_6240 [Chaetomium olivicolor]
MGVQLGRHAEKGYCLHAEAGLSAAERNRECGGFESPTHLLAGVSLLYPHYIFNNSIQVKCGKVQARKPSGASPRAYTRVRRREFLGHGIERCARHVKLDGDDTNFARRIRILQLRPRAPLAVSLEHEARNLAVPAKVLN